jgi:UDP-N-acetylmuramoylalanine--D-glutamate ligase
VATGDAVGQDVGEPLGEALNARANLEGLTLDGLRGRRVAVLGFARSGVALARFLIDAGARVAVYDVRPREELEAQIDALEGRPAELLLGPGIDPAAALAGQDLIATSPSVSARYSTTEPRLRSALADVEAAGLIPIAGEVDLFLHLCPATTIGVTGTKGKTTTASLIAAVLEGGLEGGDRRVWLGGNMGTPLIERVVEMGPPDRVVLELSELQLATLSRGPDVAVYTNVTADHLDRHGSVEAYQAVKARLAALTWERNGVVVLNEDDTFVAALARLDVSGEESGQASVLRYGLGPPASDRIGVSDGSIVAVGSEPIMPVAEVPLRGRHNLSNVLAAVAVGLHFAIAPAAIRAAVRAFPGVEHRLETVAIRERIRFVNDSQGTQPDAVVAALRAFEPPIVLIAGGRDKGLDLAPLALEVGRRAHGAVLIGESAGQLERLFRNAGLERIEHAASMDEAVHRATEIARAALEGDAHGAGEAVVLLSPAAASFDMFEDYAARGAAFKAAVAGRGATPGLVTGDNPR